MVTVQPLASFSLLFVEDDEVVRQAIGRMVAWQFPDATVYTAENGLIGLELFKEHTPEIVITDINMSVMDGIQMAGKIKSLKPDTMLIVLTGYSDKNYLDRLNEIGINDYIVKPIDLEELFAAIEKCRAKTTL
jgi:YesN/AraC family two-component response regulator